MRKNIQGGIVYIIFGFIFAIVVGYWYMSATNFEKNAEMIIGSISTINVEEYTDDEGEIQTNHEVYVKYTVNEQEYEAKLNAYFASWHVGKELELYYDPANPHFVQVKGNKHLMLLFGIIPLGLIIVGVLMIIGKVENGTFYRSKKLVSWSWSIGQPLKEQEQNKNNVHEKSGGNNE